MTQNDFYDTASKAYVRFVLHELKLSPSALAKNVGISSTTLTRALNDPTHKFTLSMKTLGKIMTFSGISVQPFFDAKDFADMSMVPYASKGLYDDSWGENANATDEDLATYYGSTIVIGETSAGIWKAPELSRLEEDGVLLLAVPNVRKVDSFALRIGDDTGAPFALPGEYAVCTRRSALKWSISHGDLVAVERWTEGRTLMELTLRRVIETVGGPPRLRFDNPASKIKEELVLPPDFSDSAELKIIGLVSYSVRDVHDDALADDARRYFRRTKILD